MTVGHIKEILQWLPDDMLIMVPIDMGNDSIVVPVCNKSKVQQIYVGDTDKYETVLYLEPCLCGLEVEEGAEEIANALMINDAIDN